MSEDFKLIQGAFGKRACSNLATDLRALADAVDRGEVIDFVAAYVENEEFQILFAASQAQSVFLSTLLHRRAVDNCFAPP